MNRFSQRNLSPKGFFSFIAVLAMSLVLLEVSVMAGNNSLEFEKTRNDLVQLEGANKERTIMENNCDKIVSLKLAEQVMLGNLNSLSVQREINSALLNYLQGRAYATNLFLENGAPLTLEYLNQNTSAFVLRANGVTYAEWAYTSNEMKTNKISSKLGKHATLNFTIQIGYTQRILR